MRPMWAEILNELGKRGRDWHPEGGRQADPLGSIATLQGQLIGLREPLEDWSSKRIGLVTFPRGEDPRMNLERPMPPRVLEILADVYIEFVLLSARCGLDVEALNFRIRRRLGMPIQGVES